jgi:hypothetical protein
VRWFGFSLLLLAAGPARGTEPALRLQASAELRCPDAVQLHAALVEALPGWRVEAGAPGDEAAWLSVTAAPGAKLQLELGAPGREPERREVEVAPDACLPAARAVALIAKLGLRRLPTAPPEPAPAPPPPPAPKPERAVHHRAAPRASGTSTVAIAPAERTPIPAPASNPSPSAPPPAALPPERAEDDATVGGPEDEPVDRASPLHVEALLGGAAFSGLGTGVGAAAGLGQLDLGLGDAFGLRVGAGMDTPLSDARDGGAVVVQRTAFELGARWSFTATRGALLGRLHLEASALLQRLSAQATGFARTTTRVAVDPGLGLGVHWEQMLWHGLGLWLGPQARLWAREDAFVVENLGTLVLTPRLWMGLSAGVAWRFF